MLAVACGDADPAPAFAPGYVTAEPIEPGYDIYRIVYDVPQLRPDVAMVMWNTQGDGGMVYSIRAAEEDLRIRSVAELKPYVAPIETADDAIAYARLVRYTFDIPEAEVPGESFNRFAVGIKEKFGAELETTAERNIGLLPAGWVVRRAIMEHVDREWRLVRLEEHIDADGTYTFNRLRTLASGDEARPFVVWRH